MMLQASLDKRQRMLSLWVQGRLSERETVRWGVSTAKQARGQSRQTTIELFEFLDQHAQAAEPPTIAKIWKLLAIATKDTPQSDSNFGLYEIDERIKQGKFRPEDVEIWVDCLRPRLVAEEASRWSQESASENDPDRWVRWSLKTTEEIGNDGFLPLTGKQADLISEGLLLRFIERGTTMLVDALSLAESIGWVNEDYDISNHSVHRVFSFVNPADDGDSSEDNDPDRYDDNFAPIVRTLSAALNALKSKDPGLAAKAARIWQDKHHNLFRRLFAFAAWDPKLVSSQDAVSFLVSLNEKQFWRWDAFPEMATLRAMRWTSFGSDERQTIESRLLAGPDQKSFSSEVTASTLEYYRDHEVARLVDNYLPVPATFAPLVSARRAIDNTFPPVVPIIDMGLPGPKVGYVPEGNPNQFDDLPESELLTKLQQGSEKFHFDHGDDAYAFARTQSGKLRIVEALANTRDSIDRELLVKTWLLLLSNPSDVVEENEGLVAAKRIGRAALSLLPETFAEIADRLCFWLDATDEKVPAFEGADLLWERLLPHAARLANSKDPLDDQETDLSMAALNEPLGHLISLFLRRCPALHLNEVPGLPQQFVRPLKEIAGRAHELLANRLAIQIEYFYRTDSSWIDQSVLRTMGQDGEASERLWEAFAKYARIPPPEVWRRLESLIFRHLTLSLLSPDAKRRLSEMCVMAWVWTRRQEAPFNFISEQFRVTLELASDAVRAAVAAQFARTIGSFKDTKIESESKRDNWEILGEIFFQEIWPLEPRLQSATSADDFARIPARVRIDGFGSAVNIITPYLVPFEVWSVKMSLGLDPEKAKTKEIIGRFPNEVLTLLAATIGEQQSHNVFDLKKLLDVFVETHPNYQSDLRLRALRRLAPIVT